MSRSLTRDTAGIKRNLEKLVLNGEALVRNNSSFLGVSKKGISFIAATIAVYDGYKTLNEEIGKDAQTANKAGYFAQTIREGANYLAQTVIDRYVKP